MSPARIGGKPAPRSKQLVKSTESNAKTAAQNKQEDANSLVATVASESKQEESADVAVTQVPLDVQANYTKLAPKMVAISQIVMPKTQPRRYFSPEAMQSLVSSVEKDGILQPVLLRPLGDNYELVAGERRLLAATKASFNSVPAVIREMSDAQAWEYAIAENLQREDLNPLEETEGILQLLSLRTGCSPSDVISLLYRMENEAKGKVTRRNSGREGAEIVEQVFTKLGRMNWQSFIRTRLPLLRKSDDILTALRAGRIEYTKALEIAKLESESDRKELLSDAIELSLSLAEIQKQVKAKRPTPEIHQLQSRLESTYKKAKQLKVWEKAEKREKLESLLAELEALIGEKE
jgi:ParB family transcriptional regulator, chromosome partitioning protein